MKRILALAAALLLLTACTAKIPASSQPQAQASTNMDPVPPASVTAVLTKEDAEIIALEHAGFTADQVVGLRTKYDIDDGIAVYEIDFHVGQSEYDYTIHAETGEILEWEIDR